jgi:hypothetical protein
MKIPKTIRPPIENRLHHLPYEPASQHWFGRIAEEHRLVEIFLIPQYASSLEMERSLVLSRLLLP